MCDDELIRMLDQKYKKIAKKKIKNEYKNTKTHKDRDLGKSKNN